MLPRPNRLVSKKDFDRVWKQGRAFFVPAIGVKIARNGLTVSRFGFVVATTVSKRAIDRNRIKRRWRGLIARELAHIPTGIDVTIMARPPIMQLTRKETEAITLDLLRRARVL